MAGVACFVFASLFFIAFTLETNEKAFVQTFQPKETVQHFTSISLTLIPMKELL